MKGKKTLDHFLIPHDLFSTEMLFPHFNSLAAVLVKNNTRPFFPSPFPPAGFQIIKRFIIKLVDFPLPRCPRLWESIFICNYEMNSISYSSEALKVIMNPLTQQTLQKAYPPFFWIYFNLNQIRNFLSFYTLALLHCVRKGARCASCGKINGQHSLLM